MPPYVAPIQATTSTDVSLDGERPFDGTSWAGARRFLFVGALEPHKRPELAISAVAELARRGESSTLSIVGSRPVRRRVELESHAQRLGIADRVAFIDRPGDGALGRLYATSTLLATSSTEGFGLPPVEAILAGGRVAAVPTAIYREVLTGVASFSTDSTVGSFADSALAASDSTPDQASRTALGQRFGAIASTTALRAAYEAFGVV